MDDVATAHSENLNLRKIQQKLLQWEKKECSLSQLTQYQTDALDRLNECQQQKSETSASDVVSSPTKSNDPKPNLSFFNLYSNYRFQKVVFPLLKKQNRQKLSTFQRMQLIRRRTFSIGTMILKHNFIMAPTTFTDSIMSNWQVDEVNVIIYWRKLIQL